MLWLSICALALAANIDGFAVGLSYGIKKTRIPVPSNLFIAGITSLGTALSLTAGGALGDLIPEGVSHILGGGLLVIFGLITLWQAIRGRIQKKPDRSIFDDPAQADRDRSGVIEPRESFLLGLALALNNLGFGVGASMLGLPVLLTTVVTFAISYLCVALGGLLGRRVLSGRLGVCAEIVSGALMAVIGVVGCLL